MRIGFAEDAFRNYAKFEDIRTFPKTRNKLMSVRLYGSVRREQFFLYMEIIFEAK